MTRVSSAFLFAKKSKECSTGVFIKLRSDFCLVLIRVWWDLNSVFNFLQ